MNSVSIHTTSPTMDYISDHGGKAQNTSIKPKVVKLNRKTLGLHVDTSFENLQSKDESNSSLNGKLQKVTDYRQLLCSLFYCKLLWFLLL